MISVHCLLLLAAITAVCASPNGAPSTACSEMMPKHPPFTAQTSTSPYTLTVSKKSIRAGDSVEVTIKGKTATDTIKGLFVQARVDNTAFGSFSVPQNNNIFLHTVNCGSQNSAITHQKILGDKPNSVSFTWKSPPGLAANVVFRYTIAKDYDVFWHPVNGPTVSIAN